MPIKASVRKEIKELHLPTTGTYYNHKIGEKVEGKRIVAWWKPGRALLEDGHIVYLRRLKRNPSTTTSKRR